MSQKCCAIVRIHFNWWTLTRPLHNTAIAKLSNKSRLLSNLLCVSMKPWMHQEEYIKGVGTEKCGYFDHDPSGLQAVMVCWTEYFSVPLKILQHLQYHTKSIIFLSKCTILPNYTNDWMMTLKFIRNTLSCYHQPFCLLKG